MLMSLGAPATLRSVLLVISSPPPTWAERSSGAPVVLAQAFGQVGSAQDRLCNHLSGASRREERWTLKATICPWMLRERANG